MDDLKTPHIIALFETNGIRGLMRTIYQLRHWRNGWREFDPDGFEIVRKVCDGRVIFTSLLKNLDDLAAPAAAVVEVECSGAGVLL